MDEFRKSTAPFYFADHIWKDKNGMTTYGMLLTNRPEDDGDYDLHSLLEEAYVDAINELVFVSLETISSAVTVDSSKKIQYKIIYTETCKMN